MKIDMNFTPLEPRTTLFNLLQSVYDRLEETRIYEVVALLVSLNLQFCKDI
jgi:hypothetical protein